MDIFDAIENSPEKGECGAPAQGSELSGGLGDEWTKEDFKEFERLVCLGESKNQMDRILSRTGFMTFMKTHTKEQCDAMFKALCDRDA